MCTLQPTAIRLSLALAIGITSAPSYAGSGNDRCVNAMNKAARKVLQDATNADRACIRKAASGNVTVCVDATDDRTEAKKAKLNVAFTALCAGAAPNFGVAPGGAATIAGAAEDAANRIAHDLFGPTVNVGGGATQRCQEGIEHRVGRLALTMWNEFRICKKKNLSALNSAGALAAVCLGGPNGPQPDPRTQISEKEVRVVTDIQLRCRDAGVSPVGGAFPGVCDDVDDADFPSCVIGRVRCRFCEAIQTVDGLSEANIDCDRFDDGADNFSCGPQPPLPTPTATATLTPTATRTPTITNTATIPPICQGMVPLPGAIQIPMTLNEGSPTCGGLALNPPPAPPLVGSVLDGGGTELGDLGLACLYAGGLSPVKLPNGATARLGLISFSLLPLSVQLGGSPGTGPFDCTLGAGPGTHCVNGAPGTDGMGLCSSDADCGVLAGACALDANCYFGPPLPVAAPLPACILSAFLTDLCGSLTLVPPAATFATALSSRIYLTFDAASPCPQCISGSCSGGKNAGQPCTGVGSANTAIECPPLDSQFFGTLTVVLPELTTGTSTLTAAPDGKFCPGQPGTGAFGLPTARTISETGTAPLLGGDLMAVDLAGTFCIPASSAVLNVSAGLPAPGAFSAAGEIDLGALLP